MLYLQYWLSWKFNMCVYCENELWTGDHRAILEFTETFKDHLKTVITDITRSVFCLTAKVEERNGTQHSRFGDVLKSKMASRSN